MEVPKRLDVIRIAGLKVQTRIGYTSEEREGPQVISFDVSMQVDTRKAAVSRHLEDTVCYSQVAELIRGISQGRPWSLVEELGASISAQIFAQYPIVQELSLTIKKFVLADTAWVGIETHRSRNEF